MGRVEQFLHDFREWASAQSDIQAVALVGSHARNAATEGRRSAMLEWESGEGFSVSRNRPARHTRAAAVATPHSDVFLPACFFVK